MHEPYNTTRRRPISTSLLCSHSCQRATTATNPLLTSNRRSRRERLLDYFQQAHLNSLFFAYLQALYIVSLHLLFFILIRQFYFYEMSQHSQHNGTKLFLLHASCPIGILHKRSSSFQTMKYNIRHRTIHKHNAWLKLI